MGALSHATLPCRSSAVSDLVLPAGVLLGDGGAFLQLRGRLVQNRREALGSLPGVVGRWPGGGSSLCSYDTTLALGGLAADRGPLPQTRRLITPQRLVSTSQSRRLVHRRAVGHLALIGTPLASIGHVFSLVRDTLALVRDTLALVRDLLPLVRRALPPGRRLRLPEHRRSLLAKGSTLVKEPCALQLQGLVIGPQLRRPAPDVPSQTRDLGAWSCGTLPAPRGPRPLHLRAVRVQLRRLTLKSSATPLKLSPLGFTTRVPLRSSGVVAGRTLLVQTLRPVEVPLARAGVHGRQFHRESIPR